MKITPTLFYYNYVQLRSKTGLLCFICMTAVFLFILYLNLLSSDKSTKIRARGNLDREHPFIFIGGYPRSGTTLMRVILDVHKSVRCGPESRVIPKMLEIRRTWDLPLAKSRLESAGLYPEAIDTATAQFIMEIIRLAGRDADRLCNKDPLAFHYLEYTAKLFSNAKFILMIRDPRAVVASIIKREVKITNVDFKNPEEIILRWNRAVKSFTDQCLTIGSQRCTVVKYEDLVLRPQKTLRQLMIFLDLPWDPVVLKHEEVLHHETSISKYEKSSSQIAYPINTEALSSWSMPNSVLPNDFIHSEHSNITMLRYYGYSTIGFPPNYGEPELEVMARTNELAKQTKFKKVFSPQKETKE